MPTMLPRAADRTPAADPDPAFAALPRLTRLREALAAARLPAPQRSRWKEPAVFFFDPARQAELEAARPRKPLVPADDEASRLIRAELPALFASAEVRRAARAVPGLRAVADTLAPHSAAARDLADLLAVPDDEVVLVLHPGSRAGFRLLVRGVADVAQFRLLMLDAVCGDPADGFLPGPPLPARFRAACRDVEPVLPAGVPMVAEARFQLFRPSALQPNGTLPTGFRGSDHWQWNREPLAAVPRLGGERVVLLGDPAYRATWEVERRFPRLAADVELLDVLGPFVVADHLRKLGGTVTPAPVERPAAPAKAA
jgi:hypothetical protein